MFVSPAAAVYLALRRRLHLIEGSFAISR